MTRTLLGTMALFSALALACGDDATDPDPVPVTASAALTALPFADNPSPEVSGQASIEQIGSLTTVTITATGCPAGSHAAHVHQGTSCGEDGVEAGPHWSPSHAASVVQKHGEDGVDLGALGVVVCDETGAGTLSFTTEEWQLGQGTELDPAGHVIMMHGLEAAERIACGKIVLD